jgi:hypothetical protein
MSASSGEVDEVPAVAKALPPESWFAVFTVVGTVKAWTWFLLKLSLNVRESAMVAEAEPEAPWVLLNIPGKPPAALPLRNPPMGAVIVLVPMTMLVVLAEPVEVLVDAVDVELAAPGVVVELVLAGAMKGIVTLKGSGVLGSISPR